MIYIDTNIFIYAIENHPKYGRKCKEILERIENGRIRACASILVLAEVLNVLVRMNKLLERSRRGSSFDLNVMILALESMRIVWFDLNFITIEKSSEYSYKMNGADYLHAATMELNSVKEMISADEDFDEVEFVKRIDPLAYK